MLLDAPAMPIAIKFSNCSVAVLSFCQDRNVSQPSPTASGWLRGGREVVWCDEWCEEESERTGRGILYAFEGLALYSVKWN